MKKNIERELKKTAAKLKDELDAKVFQLKTEAALEKVRVAAMKMKKADDLLNVCEKLFKELLALGFDELRNAMINIHNDAAKSFINYDYSDEIGKSTNHLTYDIHPLVAKQIKKIRRANDAFSETYFTGKDLGTWKRFRKRIGEKDDPRLNKSKGLFYYFYSIGVGSIGISTFGPISKEKKALLKRFRNVFSLSYQRYIDIAKAEAHAREAQIEAALEKVRSRSLAMQKSNELEQVVTVVNEKLRELGVSMEDRSASMIIFEKGSKDLVQWVASHEHESSSYFRTPYFDHPIFNDLLEAKEKGADFFYKAYTHEVKNSYFRYFFEHSDYKLLPDSTKQWILESEHYALSIAYNQNSALAIVNLSGKPLPENGNDILKRFSRVFEQSYTRFLDLQKAEAQAREAQIQLALERVRARTMAMQKSDELPEAANLLFHQIQSLGMPAWSAGYCIWDGDKKAITLWMSSEGVLQPPFRAPTTDDELFIQMRVGYEKGKTIHVVEMGGGKLVAHYQYMRTLPVVGEILDSIIEAGHPLPTFQIMHYAYFSKGFLLFITYEPVSEAHDIFKRFASVFEQTYTRFLDLQKAEAQAREAKIESALEKVRSRSLAMHKSEELQQVVTVAFERLKELDISMDAANIDIFSEGTRDADLWIASPGQEYISCFHLPYVDHLIPSSIFNAKEKGDNFFAKTFSFEEKNKYFNYLFEHSDFRHLPENRRNKILAAAAYTVSFAFTKNAAISIHNYSDKPFSDEENDILKRFAKVFEQAYVRFLDLQKAEAQARESQIQLALERIRARTMAMQHSDELAETAAVLFDQFSSLGTEPERMAIEIVNEKENVFEIWATQHGGSQLNLLIKLSLDEPHVMKKMYEAWKAKTRSITIDLQGKALEEYFQFLQTKGLPVQREIFGARRVQNVATFSKGVLTIITPVPKPKDTIEILERFAAVFDGTYTRFLDLQKAEAQAREAQIEVALERVRSRTMAMHKSSELIQTAELLFDQLKQLGAELQGVAFAICDKNSDMVQKWTSIGVFSVPYTIEPGEQRMYEAWKNQAGIYEEVYEGERQKKYYELFMEIPAFKEGLQKFIESGHPIPTWQKNHAITFKYGYLLLITTKPFNETQIFLRFGKVFEQTYTRFLDLQKAEAQAREAEIELGLERVRARAMAMRSSGELSDLVDTVFKELTKLDFALNWCIINIIDEPSLTNTVWAANPDIDKAPESYHMKFEDYPFHHAMMKGYQERKTKYVYTLEGEEKKIYDEYLFNETEFRRVPAEAQAASRAMERYVVTFTFSNFGGLQTVSNTPLSDASIDILSRFGKVFDLTYTRFNDLKQAEAQAREATIEASLERVRSKTMAMHNSQDVGDTVAAMFDEFSKLNVRAYRCGIGIFQDNSQMELWTAKPNAGGKAELINGRMNMMMHPLLQGMYNGWKNKENSFTYELEGDDTINYFNSVNSQPEYPLKYNISSLPSRLTHSDFYFTEGALFIFSLEPLSAEASKILTRFAALFGQTYRRFLDLQKAEAQAREAQIETALERVRSRTMGMQKSEELKEVIQVVYDQFVHLNIRVEHTGFIIDFKVSDDMHIWLADKHAVPFQVTIPYFDCAHWNSFNEAKEKGLNFFANHLSFEEKNKFYQDLFKLVPGVPEETLEYYFSCPGLAISTVLLENVGLYIENFSGIPYSDEDNSILMRFGKVFQQTYTRFLDLEKAEAQAREAQIEAALERVRSKTMAMHNSNDVGETVATMFAEFVHLGIHTNRCGILIFDEKSGAEVWTARSTANGKSILIIGQLDLNIHRMLQSVYKAWKAQRSFYQYALKGDDIIHYYEAINNSEYYPVKFNIKELPAKEFHSDFFFPEGAVFAFTSEAVPEEHSNIFKRFAGVFGQTYRRYLDLQKAEAQAREAQIEAALEKVRSRTMAMQRSDELSETAAVLFQEFKKIGEGDLLQVTIAIYNEAERLMDFRVTSWAGGGEQINEAFNLSIEEPTLLKPAFTAWKEQKKSIVIDLKGDELEGWLQYRNKMTGVTVRSQDTSGRRVVVFAFFSKGHISFSSPEPRPPEAVQLLERFAGVFDLTYTRFLDLKQAEAQARESQIQLALERVRARTMAMQKSDELSETVFILFQQFKQLGENPDQATIGIVNEKEWVIEYWVTMYGNQTNRVYKFSMHEPNVTNKIYKAWKEQKKSLVIDLSGKALYDFATYRASMGGAAYNEAEKRRVINVAFFSKGLINVQSNESRSAESTLLLERFAAVFEQTYTRFLDLQKAEAQAREAQIEASLEKVRSSAMAMHNSNDISATTNIIFAQLQKLGIQSKRCGIALLSKNSRMGHIYAAATSSSGELYTMKRSVEMTQHPSQVKQYESWLKQENYVSVLSGDELKSYYQLPLFRYSESHVLPDNYEQKEYGFYIPFSEGLFYAWTEKPYSENEMNILNRFKNIIELTFRRYFDLQKAEAQAREATIEAALERVRGKSMAMHNSTDLSSTASMVFTELRKLGIHSIRCGVGLLNKESTKAQLYSATSSADATDSLSLIGWIELSNHPVAERIYTSWLKNEDYYPELTGEQLKSYYENLLAGLSLPSVPNWQSDSKQYGTFLPFSVGCLYAWSEASYNDTEIKILKRFAAIIDLTFRRYMELQTSEANAREAVKQAALDRIRADIASMRTISDLDRITPLIWNELTILGVPFIRCGVFIMDESQKLIHTFLSTPDGKAIAAFHIPYTTPGNISLVLNHWHENKNYIDHWDEKAFTEFAATLVKQGALVSSEQYLKTIPQGGFYLHFLPFLQGMLYVGNTARLGDEEIRLIQSVSDAFSTAYARYEDFNKLEAAKKQVDSTLNELQATQKQLVQSEKMASLGELTAGIAHEIQNPLNFVNNFSDVSNELIDEMMEELEKGNKQEAIIIAEDVKQNLEKISHHGQRADAIVKSMLQHSRASSGKKELTDINALADEYVRLAYHGLRAKDKAFNAKFETDFDPSIEKISVIPQDLGRVLLNLINNAFYAVSEKRKTAKGDYEPTITIRTRRTVSPDNNRDGDGRGKVLIIVKDNGNGIPQKVLEKIFQPFFTTKPTGQGTGLGLSLGYDIIKAHGGEIKVETKEGDGSEFIIQLPIS